MPKKVCSKCGEEKDIGEFTKNSTTSDGYERICRDCKGEIQRLVRLRKKEKGSANGDKSSRTGKRRSRQPDPPAITALAKLNDQLLIDLKAMRKRIAQEVVQICQRAIEEAFA